ncbi:TPA: 2-hydroxycarboxylate transporter family protein [Enterobacter asburiae]
MSTTDDSFSVTHDPIEIQRPSLKERWWHIMDTWKVGIIPLPLFVLAGALIAIDCLGGKLPSDIVVMVATLAFFGFACGEFGKRLPIVGKLGAAAICATFIPSALVYYGLLPDVVVESTTKFYKSTNILYLYICCIIVGSIMSMNRTVLAVLLYMLGMLGHKLIGLPAPVGMLFMAVLVKLCNGASPRLLEGSQVVYKFFQTSVTYPILFAVGVAITPWHELVAAFTVSNLLVIVSTVSALVATGFFVGKKIGMHPIDVAIVSCCQSGQGGTGDVAILTAGNRMSLMPFAQIATRIGGAINVSVSLLILGNFLV